MQGQFAPKLRDSRIRSAASGYESRQRLYLLAAFFLLAFLADFFAAFLPALFFAPDFLSVFFAFLAFLVLPALTPAADFLAFFTALATAFTGAEVAAAFLTRPTTAFAAVLARTVAPLTMRSPT